MIPSVESPAAFVCTPIMDRIQGRMIPILQDARRDSPHLGVFLLLGHLRRAGCDCDIFDWVANNEVGLDEAAEHLAAYKLLFFSCNSLNWAAVRLLAKAVRVHNPQIKLCVGGPHPTLYPEAVAASGLFDAYFRGEADRYIHIIYESLLANRDPGLIPGYKFLNGSSNGLVPTVFQDKNLHELNWQVDYDRIPAETYLTLPVETSRGCRFSCAFCSIPSKNNWRSYPAETAVEQLEFAYEHLARAGYRRISIIDDTFTTDRQRIIQMCSALSESKFARTLMYDSTLVDLRDCAMIEALEPFTSDLLVGAEVSTPLDAKRITKAAYPKMIEEAACNLRQYNMSERAVFSFIMGFPWHTLEDCLHTLSFVTNLILDYGVRVYLQWYWPIPGSAIWAMLEKEQRVDISIVDTPGFFRSVDSFYSIRQVTPDEVAKVNERVGPIQVCLNLYQHGRSRRPLEYSPPGLGFEDAGWETRKNPFLQPAC